MSQATFVNRVLSLVDILVKIVSALLVLSMIALMILGASMTMIGGMAMLTAVINWPLVAYRRKRQQGDPQCTT
ncbi:hypothetical protein DM872_18920 [Pseudomonas taiwanensis]|uniref:hypothetical protein n=1 Tax=Pseudomonas taiwanensis TaxID=470150 RepID=UPI0015BEE142|nr:hypothetical protein [Pseudomonas taiwanensis]NWL78923.1 hypothetical protein [Pseudomonas taiwanensis]